MKRIFSVGVIAAVMILSGLGCSSDKQLDGKQVAELIEPNIKLYAVVPHGWVSTKFNALYKSAEGPSGFSNIIGGVNLGFGSVTSAGEIFVKVHVIAVPRASASVFEKGKYPINAERRFEIGDFVIYSAMLVKDDVEVKKFVESLREGR